MKNGYSAEVHKYFYQKQKNGRRDVYRVYYTDFHSCRMIQGYPSEDAAKAKVKQLISEDKK